MNDNKKDVESQIFFDVYAIWCRCTNQFYVGVTQQQVAKRIRQHRRGKKQFIDREIQRIGWEGNWDYWVVEENVPSTFITEREQYWVEFFGSRYPDGYNKTSSGIKHFRHSKKTCEDIRIAHLGKPKQPFTDEHRANISKSKSGERNPCYGKPAWNRGVPCPEEAKSKIRKKLTGRKRPDQSERMKGENNPNFGKPMPEETKAKLREKALARDMSGENNPMYGKSHTDEVKAAQSARMKGENNPNYGKSPANKGVPWTEEQKAAQSARMSGENNPFFGKHHTEEAKERNRQAHLGKPGRKGIPCSEEAKAKLRAKALARAAAKRAAKENLAAANSTPTSLSTLSDAVILQQSLRA